MVKAVKKGMRGECPVAGAGAPGSGAPRIPFSTAFTIDFLRFAGPFLVPCVGSKKRQFLGTRLVWVTRTNLIYFTQMVGSSREVAWRLHLSSFLDCGRTAPGGTDGFYGMRYLGRGRR